LLLDNKAEVILLYNEKNKNPLRKEDVMGVKSMKEKEIRHCGKSICRR
jgi:hypothetical protein